jgi:hypothetical protein
MMLRLLALSALFFLQDPPKPPDQTPPPAKPAPLELKVDTLKRALPDGVTLTGDFYNLPYPGDERPTFVCFHMENGSRAEFAKSAQRFADFACFTFAVDLRTGKATDGVANETAASAVKVLKKDTFTNESALVDVVEALKWVREMRPTGKIFALGSGTSCALVLAAVGRNPGSADAVFVFSPGEDVPGWSIANEAKAITVPTYITCDGTVAEAARARPIGHAVDKKLCKMVIPIGVQGAAHGSLVLVQEDEALRDRHWSTIVSMIMKIAPMTAQGPTETPTKKV